MSNDFWYELIKEYYNLGLYSDEDLDIFVRSKYITEEQKQEIINSKKNMNLVRIVKLYFPSV